MSGKMRKSRGKREKKFLSEKRDIVANKNNDRFILFQKSKCFYKIFIRKSNNVMQENESTKMEAHMTSKNYIPKQEKIAYLKVKNSIKLAFLKQTSEYQCSISC